MEQNKDGMKSGLIVWMKAGSIDRKIFGFELNGANKDGMKSGLAVRTKARSKDRKVYGCEPNGGNKDGMKSGLVVWMKSGSKEKDLHNLRIGAGDRGYYIEPREGIKDGKIFWKFIERGHLFTSGPAQLILF